MVGVFGVAEHEYDIRFAGLVPQFSTGNFLLIELREYAKNLCIPWYLNIKAAVFIISFLTAELFAYTSDS